MNRINPVQVLALTALLSGMAIVGAHADGSVIGESLRVGDTCSYFGERIPASVTTFGSNSEAEAVIQRIIDAAGLTANFRIRAAGVPNAAAVIEGATRYILYNPRFIVDTEQSTGTRWGPISIMAHEVGHHLNGHTLDGIGSRPDKELEADYYSGFILQKLGGTIAEAQAAMDRLGSPQASRTHPAKHDRLTAIASGWSKSCDVDPACGGGGDPVPGPRPKPKKAGPDSCEYAMDDTCDEPDLCDTGTDTTDCDRPRRRQPRQQMGRVCQTPYLWCIPGGQAPVGSPCWCNDAWGRQLVGRVTTG